MTTLSINNTATAGTRTINDVVRCTLTEHFAAHNYGVQFCVVRVSELDNDDAYRFITINLDGVFFPEETGTDLDTWCEFTATVSVVFDSVDDRHPHGEFHDVRVENRWGHELVAKTKDMAETYPPNSKTAEDTLRNLTHCLITKSKGDLII